MITRKPYPRPQTPKKKKPSRKRGGLMVPSNKPSRGMTAGRKTKPPKKK